MANNNDEEFIKINFSRKDRSTHIKVRVVTFRDGEFMIAYMPSLNLSGYGSTEREAVLMLTEVVAKDYLVSLLDLSEAQVMNELRQYGWKRRPYLDKQLLNTQFLSTEKLIEDFNLPAETKFNEQYVTV
ncbi:hypothetical protein [Spirosoma spitsbergense]|uniref:hypothetical protein n=1 Tax=Spirosoma spitsbergense TaxID=431554 RepID=UPI0003618A2B|nr:hypothetical protein [Spirosoma spitsbergense]